MTAGAAANQVWLGKASGNRAVSDLDAVWATFAATHNPVVTLFGAYDTGKSSIVRRLLVEADQAVPEWLTVSARHETFEQHDVEISGCVVRDTPGLSPGGDDARSQSNSSAARIALGLTDVVLMTLNPQLSTGERPELLEVLTWDWPDGSLWFVISRADEGGPDPMSDLAGFEAWAERKRAEVVASLDETGQRPVLIIVADYAGLEDPTLWSDSRTWDGIDRLSTALDELASADLTPLRAAAETRYWASAVRSRLNELRADLEALTTSRDAALVSGRRRANFVKQLDALVAAADVALEGAVVEAVHRVLANGTTDEKRLASTIDPVLERWWLVQQAALTRIRREAVEAIDSQTGSRGWTRLQGVYRAASAGDAFENGHRPFAPVVKDFVKNANDAATRLDKVWRAHQATKKPGLAKELLDSSETGSGWSGKVAVGAGVVEAVLPLLTWAAQRVDEQRAAQSAREERGRLREAITKIAKDAADQAMEDLAPDLEALRLEIEAQTAGGDQAEQLAAAANLLTALIADGDALLDRAV